MYGKLFSSMYDGSLYGNWKAMVTFQQMIILCGPDGVIDMTPHALAARTGIPLDIIQEGIAVLEAPDPYSRSTENDGRRIERMDGHRPWGWLIVNYAKYRRMVDAEEKREADRIRIAAKRAAERAAKDGKERHVADNATVAEKSQSVADVAQAEAEVEVKRERGRATRSPRAQRLTIETLPAEWETYCRTKRPDLDPAAAWENFRDYWTANGGTKVDWLATWRTWVRREKAGAVSGSPPGDAWWKHLGNAA